MQRLTRPLSTRVNWFVALVHAWMQSNDPAMTVMERTAAIGGNPEHANPANENLAETYPPVSCGRSPCESGRAFRKTLGSRPSPWRPWPNDIGIVADVCPDGLRHGACPGPGGSGGQGIRNPEGNHGNPLP
ncbi:MAG: hypothetical protein GY850_42440 [bacterium]|nr:hypothetical protein [bacterium]